MESYVHKIPPLSPGANHGREISIPETFSLHQDRHSLQECCSLVQNPREPPQCDPSKKSLSSTDLGNNSADNLTGPAPAAVLLRRRKPFGQLYNLQVAVEMEHLHTPRYSLKLLWKKGAGYEHLLCQG